MFSCFTVFASSINASDITYKDTNVKDAIDDLYLKEKSREFNSYLIVHGQVGSFAEFNLIDTKYKKFKYTKLSCASSANTVSIYVMNSTFNNSIYLAEDTEYEINDTYYRLFLKKTNGIDWCQIKLTLYN